MTESSDLPIPFKLFGHLYKWPSEAQMRNYCRRAKKYNIEEAFIKIGGRLLVKPNTFFELIEKRNRLKNINEKNSGVSNG